MEEESVLAKNEMADQRNASLPKVNLVNAVVFCARTTINAYRSSIITFALTVDRYDREFGIQASERSGKLAKCVYSIASVPFVALEFCSLLLKVGVDLVHYALRKDMTAAIGLFFSSPEGCEAFIGDLQDRFYRIHERCGLKRASRWYLRQLLNSLGPLLWARMKHIARSAALVTLWKIRS